MTQHTASGARTGQAMNGHATANAMLSTHPMARGSVSDALTRCIEACFDCAMACNACADACLGEANVTMLRKCIRLNNDCADICLTTGRALSRLVEPSPRIRQSFLQACMAACIECGEECRMHAEHHEHCRVCADECARCADACQQALDTFVSAGG
jgi:hypothetical protein